MENTDLGALTGAIASINAENTTAEKARRTARALNAVFGPDVRPNPDDNPDARIKSQDVATLAEIIALYRGEGAEEIAAYRLKSVADLRAELTDAYREVGYVRETDEGETLVREPVKGSIGPHLAPALVFARNAYGVDV